MSNLRNFGALGIVLCLGACVAAPPVAPVAVAPGPGKDAAAFQRDDVACRQQASAQVAAVTGAAPVSYGAAWAQCMASRGDTVQPPTAYAAAASPWYPYPYPYAYAGAYPYYPYYGGYFGPDIAIGFGGGWGGGGWGGRGWDGRGWDGSHGGDWGGHDGGWGGGHGGGGWSGGGGHH